jgi:hypothetical protein
MEKNKTKAMKLNKEKLLVESWCVQCDGSERFKEVMRAMFPYTIIGFTKDFYYGLDSDSFWSKSISYSGLPFGTELTLDELCELVGWEAGKDTDAPTNANPLDWVSDEEIKSWQVEGESADYNCGIIAGADMMRQRMAEEFKKRMK